MRTINTHIIQRAPRIASCRPSATFSDNYWNNTRATYHNIVVTNPLSLIAKLPFFVVTALCTTCGLVYFGTIIAREISSTPLATVKSYSKFLCRWKSINYTGDFAAHAVYILLLLLFADKIMLSRIYMLFTGKKSFPSWRALPFFLRDN